MDNYVGNEWVLKRRPKRGHDSSIADASFGAGETSRTVGARTPLLRPSPACLFFTSLLSITCTDKYVIYYFIIRAVIFNFPYAQLTL